MNILITGVAGLLGSRLAEHIVNTHSNVTVIGIDDLSGGFKENIPDKVIWYECNITNAFQLEHIFQKYRFDVVYHFAAYAAEGLSPFIRGFNYTNNVVATARIVNMCIKYNVGRLVFTSSMAVYGDGTPPFIETDPRRPIDPYGIAKSACEQDIEVAGIQHGLSWCIIRPHNVYGRNQNIFDPYRNFIGIAMYKGLIGDPITIYGDGLQTRAFSEMTDSLEPLWQAGISPKAHQQIINLGGISEYTILETAELVSKLSGVPIIHLPARHEVKHAFASWQKSIDILNFQHNTSLSTGIERMWEWAKTVPRRSRFVWPSYEIDVGLYPYWKQDALQDGFYKDTK